jgi:hypothetical protein
MGLIPAQSGVFIQPKTPFAAIKHTLSGSKSGSMLNITEAHTKTHEQRESHTFTLGFLRRASRIRSALLAHQFSNSFRRFHHQLNRRVACTHTAKTVGTRAVCLGPNSIHKRRRVSIFQLTSSSAHLACMCKPPFRENIPRLQNPISKHGACVYLLSGVLSHFINTRAAQQ